MVSKRQQFTINGKDNLQGVSAYFGQARQHLAYWTRVVTDADAGNTNAEVRIRGILT